LQERNGSVDGIDLSLFDSEILDELSTRRGELKLISKSFGDDKIFQVRPFKMQYSTI
jgi:hypothetical protein